jgi:hypothetical protein
VGRKCGRKPDDRVIDLKIKKIELIF